MIFRKKENFNFKNEFDSPLKERRVTDLTFLVNLCSGDDVKIKKYISLYLRLAPVNIEKMGDALENRNFGVLLQTIHDMKSHLKCMGMEQTMTIAQKIERYALAKGGIEFLPELLSQFRDDFEKSRNELELI
jgi:HPt (histidine-containing phosphotransfer) domain-containing protein